MSNTAVPGDPWGITHQDSKDNKASAKEVNDFHTNSDVDSSTQSYHHRLGNRRNQASQGDHRHDGENGLKIMEGVTVTGAKAGNAALTNLLTALAAALGFIDGTT